MYSNLLIGGADDKISNSQPDSGAIDEKIPVEILEIIVIITQSNLLISIIHLIRAFIKGTKKCPEDQTKKCWTTKQITFFTLFMIFLISYFICFYMFYIFKKSSPVVLSFSKENIRKWQLGSFVGGLFFAFIILEIIYHSIPDEDNDEDNTNSPN